MGKMGIVYLGKETTKRAHDKSISKKGWPTEGKSGASVLLCHATRARIQCVIPLWNSLPQKAVEVKNVRCRRGRTLIWLASISRGIVINDHKNACRDIKLGLQSLSQFLTIGDKNEI